MYDVLSCIDAVEGRQDESFEKLLVSIHGDSTTI